MTEQILHALEHVGLTVVVANVFVNQIGLPLPAVPTLIIAGAAVANGRLAIGAVFVGSVLACLIADCGWYALGRHFGIRVLKTLCKISLEPDSCVSNTQARFERWGINSIIVGKFIPGLSTIAPPLAGAMRVGWAKFLGLATLSAMLWSGTWLAAGIVFSAQVGALLLDVDRIGGLAGLVAALLLACYVAYKWWERTRFFKMLRMARINVTDLYELMRTGLAPLVVDVRSHTARNLEPRWIPGAIHVPLEDAARHLKDLPRDRDIILYCSCPSEASAARVARLLMQQGFSRVRPLFGGLEAWLAAGYAVEFAPPASVAMEVQEKA